MKSNLDLTRRKFFQVSAAGLSFMYLPGIGRIKAKPLDAGDYYGRLCYNENPVGVSPYAWKTMREAVSNANRYPDWFSDSLKQKIADQHDLPKNNICVGAGATEIIRLIADAFLGSGDEMITASPTYFQMGVDAVQNGATLISVPVDENYVIDLNGIYEAITSETKLISLVNPNNPLPTCVHKGELEDFIYSLPGDIIVVVDEAYHHYVQSPDYESCMRYVVEDLPVIIIRTFSKAYGMAGARIGYSVAPAEYTAQIASSQLFGTVSSVSQAGAMVALGDTNHLDETIQINKYSKVILKKGFEDLNLDYIPSETNFIMFDTGLNASEIASDLASRRFQVRVGWGMPQHIRVSTGLPDEMVAFIAALEDVMAHIHKRKPALGFGIHRISPNYSVNSPCSIRISTVGNEKASLMVFNKLGRKIKTIVNNTLKQGVHNISWDYCDVFDKRVQAGDYIVILQQGEFAVSAKISVG